MSSQVGVVKQLSGSVIAVDANGNQRVLHIGDAIFAGEVVKTTSNANAVLSMDNGKQMNIGADDSVLLDSSVTQDSSFGQDAVVADLTDLQKAILAGADLSNLEETAAGGGAGGGEGGTAQINPAYFADGGHYSNVNADYRGLGSLGNGGLAPFTSIGGAPGDIDDLNLDDTPPRPDVIANKDGSVDVYPETDNTDGVKTDITYTDQNGKTHTVSYDKQPDGTWKKDPSTDTNNDFPNTSVPDGDKQIIKIPPGVVKNDTDVTDTTTDDSGNNGEDRDRTFDSVKPTIDVVLTEDVNNDEVLSKAENKNSGLTTAEVKVGNLTGSEKVSIEINNETTAREFIVSKNGKELLDSKGVKVADIDQNGEVKFTLDDVVVQDGKKTTITATVVDPANNKAVAADEVM
ncbi:retention module-containing protein, partial [Campylobacter mucosalis]|uniref:retention module-containing protein n=1 Tax=Campylobacter mucosalis TaxID=202 RepID=UPI0014701FEC